MTVTISQAAELDNMLSGISVKLHMRDACGGQAFYLEGNDTADAKRIIENYFSKLRATVHYYDDKNFTVK